MDIMAIYVPIKNDSSSGWDKTPIPLREPHIKLYYQIFKISITIEN